MRWIRLFNVLTHFPTRRQPSHICSLSLFDPKSHERSLERYTLALNVLLCTSTVSRTGQVRGGGPFVWASVSYRREDVRTGPPGSGLNSHQQSYTVGTAGECRNLFRAVVARE